MVAKSSFRFSGFASDGMLGLCLHLRLYFLCLVDKKGQLSGLCVFLCLVDKKGQENPIKFGCVFLIFKFGFVFIVFLLKMNLDLNLCIEF